MKFDKPTLITITAPTCAGKDYLLTTLCAEFMFEPIVSYTTRPMREGERQGREYYFISRDEFEHFDNNGVFCETAEFRGNRYGVSWTELDSKIGNFERSPIVILEPSGVEHFQKICATHNWDMFKIYIHADEGIRRNRLIQRTKNQLAAGADVTTALTLHTDRIVSMMSEERRWSQTQIWDAIVPGNDIAKAVEMVTIGIRCRNRKVAEPTVYNHIL